MSLYLRGISHWKILLKTFWTFWCGRECYYIIRGWHYHPTPPTWASPKKTLKFPWLDAPCPSKLVDSIHVYHPGGIFVSKNQWVWHSFFTVSKSKEHVLRWENPPFDLAQDHPDKRPVLNMTGWRHGLAEGFSPLGRWGCPIVFPI